MRNYRCMGCMKEYDDSLTKCPHCSYVRGMNPKEPYYLMPETVLDSRYIVGTALGSGTFGITYLAWDYVENCKVVIKEYFPQEFATRMLGQKDVSTYDGEKSKQFEAGLRAFLVENTNLADLSKNLEGVAETKCTFIENSTGYAVVEYIDGVSFDKVLKNGKIRWQDVIQIMKPVLDALTVIHKNGLINYNISPDEIIMTRDKKVKLLSFGGSKLETAGSIKNFDMFTKPGFSPFEMYKEEHPENPSIDVYSIAAVMYNAITGIAPPNAMERANKDTLKKPSDLGINIPENVENALLNALNVNCQYRTSDCAAFLSELNSDKVERVAEVKKKEDTGKLSKKAKVLIISASILVVAAVLTIVFTQSNVSVFKSQTDVFPDLSGMSVDEVEKTLDRYKNIDYEIIGTLEGDEAEEGTVIWQSIEPKSRLEESVVVELKIAASEVTASADETENITMPSLIAKTLEEAKATLETVGLTNYTVKTTVTVNYRTGIVCDQSVAFGKTVDKDERIIIYVSQNNTPKVTTSTTASVKVNTATTETAKEKATTKVSTATTKAPEKTTAKAVTTTEATTSNKVTVPDVVGKDFGSAKKELMALGFLVQDSTVYTTDETLVGKVQTTLPAGGTESLKDSLVTVYIYNYKASEEE